VYSHNDTHIKVSQPKPCQCMRRSTQILTSIQYRTRARPHTRAQLAGQALCDAVSALVGREQLLKVVHSMAVYRDERFGSVATWSGGSVTACSQTSSATGERLQSLSVVSASGPRVSCSCRKRTQTLTLAEFAKRAVDTAQTSAGWR